MNRAVRLEELEPLILPCDPLLYAGVPYPRLACAEAHTAAIYAAAEQQTTALPAAAVASLRDRLTALVAEQEALVERLSLTADIALQRLEQAEADMLPRGKIAVRTIIFAGTVAEFKQAQDDLEMFRAILTADDAHLGAAAQATWDQSEIIAIWRKHDAADAIAASEQLRTDNADFGPRLKADQDARFKAEVYSRLVQDNRRLFLAFQDIQ